MSTTAELDGLLSRLVDDQLDEAGTARLQDVLSGDATARRRYRQALALHAHLRWDYVSAEREVRSAPRRALAFDRRWLSWAGALAASLVVALTLARWPAQPAATLLTTTSLSNGTLTWSDGATQRTLDVAAGIPAGRLILEGDGAIAVLRFADDTTLTLAGDSELAVDEQSGKHVDLRRGTLSAEVMHQPAGRPLVVTTATARLEVLGTIFTVGAGVETTTLAVEQGRVRMERLADQEAVEVAAGQQVSVTFDAAKRLAVVPRPRIPDAWRADFAQRPPTQWSGTWNAPAGGTPGFLAAVPYVAGRDAAGRPFIHHGVRVDGAPAASRSFVSLHERSHVTLRFRAPRGDARTQVKVMLCVARGNGAFGGTFFASVDPQALPADGDGWRTAVLAMPSFVPTRPSIHPTPVGNAATFILVNTAARPAGLEVSALAVDQP